MTEEEIGALLASLAPLKSDQHAKAREVAALIDHLIAEKEQLLEAFEPFLNLRTQSKPAHSLINKRIDGLRPFQITVTADQFRAAWRAYESALAAAKGGGE